MADDFPPFASTTGEIRLAVEQNAIDRGTLFLRVIVSLDIEDLLRELKRFTLHSDKEEWRERSLSIGIREDALFLLDESNPPIPYVYYFTTPELLVAHPRLIFYCRNAFQQSHARDRS